MTFDEMDRLDEDHPTWALLSTAEFMTRYWMYDARRVRLARAAVHWRRLLDVVSWPAGWLAGNLR